MSQYIDFMSIWKDNRIRLKPAVSEEYTKLIEWTKLFIKSTTCENETLLLSEMKEREKTVDALSWSSKDFNTFIIIYIENAI